MDTSNLFHTLNQKVRLFSKELNEQLQEYGLYTAQWTILYTLTEKGPMTQTDIWQYLKVEAPTVTRTLVRMEASGWIIRRHGADKRERIVELTDMAKKTFPLVKKSIQTMEQQYIMQLTELEQQQLLFLLEKLGPKRNDFNENE
ncbi:MarR family winged helix-turn-helix transcriptional regulator [Halalkalibacter alkalisediminis]|uniref:MarR family winged helix-turn-helix transcriptional regulator n=1 Tax=Halalkalibacter alkalisediminis TaxID=935616 RepID=A0ABV6NQD4_9BACI|nr:MarR family transcriptional regulator [Halalkalibacter alkalisediminis]